MKKDYRSEGIQAEWFKIQPLYYVVVSNLVKLQDLHQYVVIMDNTITKMCTASVIP